MALFLNFENKHINGRVFLCMVRNKLCLVLSCLAIILFPVKSQNNQCSLCPVGKYKASTSNSACVSCPADTYQDILGAISLTQCKPCPTNSYAPPGSSSMSACSCAAGYGGDVSNYAVGLYTDNLARNCTGTCLTLTNKVSGLYPSSNALDDNIQTYSLSDTVLAGDVQFSGMVPWWRVQFEREAIVQSVVITNYDSRKMSNFFIRVGNDANFNNMNTLTVCAGPLTWSDTTSNTYTCNTAVRGRYLYIINGNGQNSAVVLSEVKVRGYLMPATEACNMCAAGSFKSTSGPGTCTACAAGKASANPGSTSSTTCINCAAGKYSGAGSSVCVDCPSNANSLVASASISSCSCNVGYTAVPSTVSCNAFQTLYQAKKPWAHYTATKWDDVNKVLLDQSGNNRNTEALGTRASIVQGETVSSLNGASQPLTYIAGDISTSLFFASGSIPEKFTICSVTRYASTINQKRVLTAVGKDWLHGHYEGKRGVAYYGSRDKRDSNGNLIEARTYNTDVDNVGTTTNWMVMCSKNGGTTPLNILIDGQASGTSTRSDSDPNEWGTTTMDRATQLCINCRTGEKSDWELAHLLVWDTHLSNSEMNLVSEELRSYLPLNTVCTETPSNNCTACVPGKYKSSTGGDPCIDCGAGKYQTNTGAIGANMCLDCPLNTNSPVSSSALTSCTCNTGYEGALDGQVCSACVKGSYKTNTGTGTCIQCAADTFSTILAATSMSTCSSCPMYASTGGLTGSDEATDCTCNAGYTGANGGTCLACVTGTYKTASGAQACTLCPNNTYSSAVAATLSSTCSACQANAVSVMGSDAYTDCHCLPGYLTNNIGLPNATCTQCSAGSFNPTLGATTCSKCQGGYQSSSPGAVSSEQCVGCPVNTWSPTGAAQCEACPGNSSALALSDEITDCKCLAGYYSVTGQDGATCQACPAGTFKPLPGAAACTQCPVNTYSTALAATSSSTCQACTNNAVSPVGSSSSSMCLCDLGFKIYIPTISNLARSCGVSFNQPCLAQVDSFRENGGCQGTTTTETCASFGTDNNEWTSFTTAAAFMDPQYGQAPMDSWWRVDFSRRMTVTDVKLIAKPKINWGQCGPNGAWHHPCIVGYEWTGPNMRITVGDTDSFNSPNNALCYTTPDESYGIRTVTCTQPVTGRFLFVHQRGINTNGGSYHSSGLLAFAEVQPIGRFADATNECLACTAGTYKDTLGSAACTNCPANTYSGMSAARNVSVCTQCYTNSIAPAGSDDIYDCGCSSGYEFL